MDREELITLITKFHQGSISDLELARLKMFAGRPEAQEILENIDFPVPVQEALPPVPPEIHANIHERIFTPDKQPSWKNSHRWVAAAASLLLLVSAAAWLWNKHQAKPVRWVKIAALPGERKKIVLPDGSIVYLNAGSSVAYPERSADGNRLVYLDGEAFFEIAQQADHSFMLQTAHTTTKVLGTRFNVEAHEREGITRVALVEGKVETGDSLNKIVLLPGKMMIHENSTGRQSVLTVEGDVAGWTTGDLVFNNISLEEALIRIGEAYNIQVKMSPGISRSYTVTGRFQREQPEKILDALLAIYGLKWNKLPGGYLVSQ